MERFQVVEEKIKVLTVTILRARGISVGWSDVYDTPDPYVKLRVLTSPNAKQQTSAKANDKNPEWNETFTFYLNAEKKNTLELIIMDEDLGTRDDNVGTQIVELDDLTMNDEEVHQIQFGKNTTLDVKLLVRYDESTELRFSYDLCKEETNFVNVRKEMIFSKISKVLQGKDMPKSLDELPTIAIMGSGGGYRAMCGLSGVFCALQETGILDIVTYATGLSGSSWYISTLYSYDGWPGVDACEKFAKDLRTKFEKTIVSHFSRDFFKRMTEKRKNGQPVALTDLFGMTIGNALLDNRSSKLSHQAWKVKYGEIPLPICAGVRVKDSVSAKEFSEWVEFSPYEFGLAKYGVFGKVKDFGSKFYKGRLVKQFDEVPLSYLQGIWGSAYSILLNRVVGKKDEPAKNEEKLAHEQLMAGGIHHEKDEGDDSEDEDDVGPEDELNEGFGQWLIEMTNPMNIFSSRVGKAAEVLNVCRGLKLKREKDQGEVNHLYKTKKTMNVVDAGVAFNSPYPTLVRTERNVDIILSFDFSQRDGGDKELPFNTILQAEAWARANNLPFPPIAANPVLNEKNMRECYVFEDPDDPRCPTVLHFPLINKTFMDYVAPGVERVTKEEKDFANFQIFDDPDEPYSSFKFTYENKTFDRLHKLMKFNTLLNLDLMKEKIASKVLFHRNNKKTPL